METSNWHCIDFTAHNQTVLRLVRWMKYAKATANCITICFCVNTKSPTNIFNPLFIVKYLLGSCQTLHFSLCLFLPLVLSTNFYPFKWIGAQYSATVQYNWILRHINGKSGAHWERNNNEACIRLFFECKTDETQGSGPNILNFWRDEKKICVIPSNMFVYTLFIMRLCQRYRVWKKQHVIGSTCQGTYDSVAGKKIFAQ